MSCALGLFSSFASILVVLQLVRRVFPWIYENFLGPKLGNGVELKKFGKWAVVTGATDGIGKEYARILAECGINIVLISRTLSKLENVSKELKAEYGIETRVVDVDFKSGAQIYQKIEKGLAGIEIGILVNNVGISYSCPEYYMNIPDREIFFQELVECNIYSVLNMTRIVLPQMVERRTGAIINISSLSAVIPAPLISIYAATKAFVDKFSDDLDTEYKARGIIVQSILPGPVATNMSKIRKPTWMAPSAKAYVASAIKTLGIATHSTGYYPHALLQLSVDVLDFFSPSLARKAALKTIDNVRRKALKKMQSNNNTKDN